MLKTLLLKTRRTLVWFWQIVSQPSAYFSLGFLTLGGFVGGVVFWGAFNTALEVTNTEKFCISCHEMRDTVYRELSQTVHFSSRSGVRASCPDCHVPDAWTHKIARKMQASKEVWGKVFGTIATRSKFLKMRRELAEREWARLKANDSLECRNCHSAAAMDLSKQTPGAADVHARYLITGQKTCIDCHKGIAHLLPGMKGTESGGKQASGVLGKEGAPPDGAEHDLRAYLSTIETRQGH